MQVVKTPPFHGGNTGSNPVRVVLNQVVTYVTTFFMFSKKYSIYIFIYAILFIHLF